jgi:hypothetical protein
LTPKWFKWLAFACLTWLVLAWLARVVPSPPKEWSDEQDRLATVPVDPTKDPQALKAARHKEAIGNVKIKHGWSKEAFGTVMMLNMTITNDNDGPVKDLEITCTAYGDSGTPIGHNVRTLYQIVPGHSRRYFQKFNMGFIHDQATTAGCEVTGLTEDH